MRDDDAPAEGAPAATGRGVRALLIVALVTAVGLVAWQVILFVADNDPTQPVVFADVVQRGGAAGFNVLLITLDTTRPDHLRCYGCKWIKTPAIDSLVDHGVRFDDAVASAPLTLPSHATILTGRYPPAIGVRDNGTYHLSAEHVTLAETLKKNGYDTAAFVSCFVLEKRFGLDQGFDVYDFEADQDGQPGPGSLMHERRADAVTTGAIRWLEARHESGRAAPFFLWVHYFDPHYPYNPPGARPGQDRANAYDAEITFMDLHLGRLLDAFDERNLRDRTIIVLVSDHGESLGEHDENTHGVFVYEATIRVALILSCPALFHGAYRVDDRVVGIADVFPTVIDLLGLPASTALDGQSLFTVDPHADRAIYIESCHPASQGCSNVYGLRRHTDKYILAPRPEYFDLRKDPDELENLYEGTLPELKVLKSQLAELMTRWGQEENGYSGTREMSPEELSRLSALGYIGAGGQTHCDSPPDCKDRIHITNRMAEVVQLIALERYEEALELAKQVAAQSPGFEAPVLWMAKAYAKLNQPGKAAEMLGKFTREHPTPATLVSYARMLLALGRHDEFEKKLDAAQTLDPQFGVIPQLRGDYFFTMRRYAEAIEQYETAIEIDGDRLGPRVRQKLQQARDRLRQASP